jgi:DNA modification methylase
VPDEVKTDIVLGDLFEIGEHRLLCGDSTESDQVARLMNGEKANMVFTDPPYGMHLNADYSSAKSRPDMAKAKGLTGGKKWNNVIGDHDDFTPKLINTVFACFPDCQEVFLWGADYYAELLPNKNVGSWIVWDKRLEESTDKMYGSCFELCWSKNKHKRDIARIKWAGVFGVEQEHDKCRSHPTQKPTALAEWFFDRWGAKGDIVVDLYSGSGFTVIAAEKTERKCYGMELDPKYCQVIIDRMLKLDPTLEIKKNGQPYETATKQP